MTLTESIAIAVSRSIGEFLTEAVLDDIYTKYYSDVPQGIFWKIVNADPTYDQQRPTKMGKYTKWLLSLYNKGTLKTEDLYKATDYLRYFVKYFNKVGERDIHKYGSLQQLYGAIRQFKDAEEKGNYVATSKSDEIRKIKEGAEKFYEDDKWLVIIPKTREASCYYGKGTQWCTAADKSENMFDYYNNNGTLYINIDKEYNEKYQFYFRSLQFMDETDSPIDATIQKAIGLTDELVRAYGEREGKTAILLLTQPVDIEAYDSYADNNDPYYFYIDYDEMLHLVKIDDNFDVEDIELPELDDYDMRVNMDDTQWKTNDVLCVTADDYGKQMVYCYNVKTQRERMFGESAQYIFYINDDYLGFYSNDGNYYVVDSSFNDIAMFEDYPCSLSDAYSRYGGRHEVDYASNVILIKPNDYNKSDMLYDLNARRMILPEFDDYELGLVELNDEKEYLAYTNKDTGQYQVVNPDGSLSEKYGFVTAS